MSLKGHDKRTCIIDSANAYTARQLSKREFLRRMGLAGIGFSSFGLAMLGGHRRGRRGFEIAAPADAEGLPDNQAKWLQEVGSRYRGTKIRFTSEATPPTVVLNQIKKEFTDPTGIEVEIEIVPLEQVLSKATQDVQGRLGAYDLYYLDQSWVAAFAQDCIDPIQLYKDKPELAMPDFDFDDFCRPLVEGAALVDGKWMGTPAYGERCRSGRTGRSRKASSSLRRTAGSNPSLRRESRRLCPLTFLEKTGIAARRMIRNITVTSAIRPSGILPKSKLS